MVNFSKIPEQWDAVPSLRRRAAKGRSLLVSATTGIKQILGNVKNIAENYEVLKPIVETMTNVGNIETPGIDTLSPLLLEFYGLASYPSPEEAAGLAHQDAWGVKRCLTLLRRKWARQEIPKDCNGKGFLGHSSNYEPLDFEFSFWLPLQDARAAELVRLYEKGFAIFLKVSGCI